MYSNARSLMKTKYWICSYSAMIIKHKLRTFFRKACTSLNHLMAQQLDLRQVIIPVGDDIAYEDHLLSPQSSEKVGSRVSIGSASPDSELTQRRHREFLVNSNKGKKNEEMMMASSSHSTVRRNARLSVKRLKSRLDAPRWNNSLEDEDWILDEDVFGRDHGKKMSFVILFQLVSLVLVMIILACTLSVTKLKKIKLWDLPLWKWEILISVIISGHLVTGWGVRIVVLSIEQAFVSKNMRVLYFVYGMKKAVQHCIWLGLILIAWHYLVAEKMGMETRSKALTRVSKTLLCLVVGSFVWLVKVFLVKVLASSFYNKTFFERAKGYLFKQYVIKKLSKSLDQGEQSNKEDAVAELKARGKTELQILPQFLRQFSTRKDQVSSKDRCRKLDQRRASIRQLKRLVSAFHSGLLHELSTLDECLPDSSDDEDEKSLNGKAEKVAQKIFNSVAKGSDVIVLDDLKQYMTAERASSAMRLFEGTAITGGINEHSFTHWMIDAFKERRNLQLSLSDTKTAVDELHHLMDFVVIIMIVIIWLLIFELAVARFIVVITSQLLLVGFIFQNTLKTVFEAIIFLFIMHPYDVGDRCEIDQVQMVVEEMNILTTAFERYDGQKVVYPNSVLATKPIGNYNRSPDMGDQIQFSVHISTPLDKISIMKEKIKSYIESNEKYWHPDPMILIKDVEDMNKLVMVVWPRHRINHQDMGKRWSRRALLIDEMIKIFRKLDIQYRMLPLDMNLRTMPAATCDKFPSNWTTCSCSG